MNVDGRLEDIWWMRGLEVERLPPASYALLPNLKKGLFLPSERDREFLPSVFYTPASKCVCIRRLAGARHLSPAVLLALWPEGGSEPPTSAPSSEFMTQSLALSMDIFEDSESRRFESSLWRSFSQVYLGPTSGQEFFWGEGGETLDFFQWRLCAHSERYRNLLAGIFEIQTFFGNIEFPLASVYKRVWVGGII